MEKKRRRRRIFIIIGVIAAGLLYICLVGWRPFAGLEPDDLYYVTRRSRRGDPQVMMLEEDAVAAFASLLRAARVYPSPGMVRPSPETVEKLDLHAPDWFVFEYSARKGKVMFVQVGACDYSVYKYLRLIFEDWRPNHWMVINGRIYWIREELFKEIEAFGRSLSSPDSP